MTPILIYFSYINEFVKDALRDGWVPVIIAMLISRLAGFETNLVFFCFF